MTLYELLEEYQRLQDLIDDDDVTEDEVADTMSMNAEDITDKVEGYCMVMKNTQAEIEAIKAEKMRLASKQARLEKKLERLRKIVAYAMALTNRKSIKTSLFSLNLRQTSSLVLDVPETELPDEFKRVTVSVDKEAMKKFMKDNAMLSTSFAHFETTESLVVR